ncbi:MAG: transporter substrate-binding domain-containing protein [Ruminococcaceae bacterium]|nr:transporter substrate-binding domain-containing protein [Oscillospiraceae bacterium]
MFKKVLCFSLAVMMCFALVACGGEKTNTDGKTYTIATDTTFPPFEYQDENGDYVGIDIELLAAIAADQGFQYELQPLGFDAACAALESGQADGVIAGMSIKPERKEKYDFSDPYFDSAVIVAVKADAEYASLEDLKGQTIAVKNGTEGASYAESIAAEYGFTVKTFEDSPTMYMEVTTGNAAACVEDYEIMRFGVENGNGLKMVGEKNVASSYGFAVQKGQNPELLEMFNKGFANLKANGKYDEILAKYLQ